MRVLRDVWHFFIIAKLYLCFTCGYYNQRFSFYFSNHAEKKMKIMYTLNIFLDSKSVACLFNNYRLSMFDTLNVEQISYSTLKVFNNYIVPLHKHVRHLTCWTFVNRRIIFIIFYRFIGQKNPNVYHFSYLYPKFKILDNKVNHFTFVLILVICLNQFWLEDL